MVSFNDYSISRFRFTPTNTRIRKELGASSHHITMILHDNNLLTDQKYKIIKTLIFESLKSIARSNFGFYENEIPLKYYRNSNAKMLY